MYIQRNIEARSRTTVAASVCSFRYPAKRAGPYLY